MPQSTQNPRCTHTHAHLVCNFDLGNTTQSRTRTETVTVSETERSVGTTLGVNIGMGSARRALTNATVL